MKKLTFLLLIVLSVLFASCTNKPKANESNINPADTISMKKDYIKADVYETSGGPLRVTLVGHASLMFEYAGKIIHVDPYSQVADYSKLPKADLILLTHEHPDHLDSAAISLIKKESTHFIVSKVCNEILGYGDILNNGDKKIWNDISIDAVPAYNIVNKKPDGQAYHPKGRGNGYVLKFGDLNVYVAGDTENIPEMEQLKGAIGIAFLPKNLPYTMTDDMFVDAAKKVMPKVLYPYHMSEFDQDKIGKALEGTGIKLEVRPMKN